MVSPAFSSRHTSYPSVSGITMSSMNNLGSCARIIDNAILPAFAERTLNPALLRISVRREMSLGLSSTRKMSPEASRAASVFCCGMAG